MKEGLNQKRLREILALKERRNEKEVVLASKIVDYAKSHPRSALHSAFQWDDKKAAHQYRLDQARHLIRVLVIPYQIQQQVISIKAFVALPGDRRFKDGGYTPLNELLDDGREKGALLAMALKDIEMFLGKYNMLCELADVIEEMKKLVAKYRG